MNYKKVGVLMGGLSAEREVSLESGSAIAAGLRQRGYEVVEIDVDQSLDVRLRESGVEAVYIALHGRYGEDGTVQGMLEMMKIPYTGSPVTASAVSMDKQLTRILVAAAGLPVANGAVLNNGQDALPPHLSLPVVIKPVTEGSSVGVSIAKTEADFATGLATAFGCADRVLIETFIEGREIQVALLDGEVLGAIEIEPNREFFDYEAKYTEGGANHHIPPRVPESVVKTCTDFAKVAYDTLACAGLARIDLIVPEEETPVILEVNTSPGMTVYSLAPEIAAHAGISYEELVDRIMRNATLHVG
jgi:D-alanine-D-alanine ligase